MILVVDASVAVKWYVEEEFSEDAARLLSDGHELHVPELIYPEFGNILWKKVRRGEAKSMECRNIVDRFRRLAVDVHSHQELLKAAYIGAELTGQTVYDWTYLALAVSLKCKFITADQRFFKSLKGSSMARHLLWIEDF